MNELIWEISVHGKTKKKELTRREIKTKKKAEKDRKEKTKKEKTRKKKGCDKKRTEKRKEQTKGKTKSMWDQEGNGWNNSRIKCERKDRKE